MIKANELRIGNYVNVPRKDQSPFRIDGFEYLWDGSYKVNMQQLPNTHGLTWYEKDCEPIPLTPELLEKCGFEKATDSFGGWMVNIWEDEKIRIVYNGCTFVWPLYGNKEVAVTYLHQLQNLYFALTNEELKITL